MIAKALCALSVAIIGATPALADPQNAPFIRTGHDLIERCEISSPEAAYRCQGMYDVFEDAGEAGRDKDNCPPAITQVVEHGVPVDVQRMLVAASKNPQWLDLPAALFVDKVERSDRCNIVDPSKSPPVRRPLPTP